MKDKEWKEKTKLDKKNKIMISFYIFMIIFEIVIAIIQKNFSCVVFALLWMNIAIMEYCNSKLLKQRDALIDIQEQYIKTLEKTNISILQKILKENGDQI